MRAPWSGRRRLLTVSVATVTVAATIAAYLALTAGTATAKQFATLTVLEGTVEVHETGGSGFQPGTSGDTLRQGDTVRTGDDGRADIEYFDGSVTRLDAGTELVLQELAADPEVPGSKTIVADQSSGKTLNRVIELTDSESRFETETPSAVASVRGTVYVVIVHPNGSSEYWVLEGTLLIELPDGTIIELNEGEGVFVDPEGNAGEVFQVEDADIESLCALDEEFCEDEVEGVEIENENEETDEPDEVQGTTVSRVETEDDVTLIPPIVIIRPTPGPGGDTRAPQTTIQSGPENPSEERDAAFVVHSDEPNSTFECSLDGGGEDAAFGPCPEATETARATQAAGETTMVVLYTDLIDDLYSFQVRATDAAGNTDDTPAGTAWDVSAPPDTTIESLEVDGDSVSALLLSDEPGTFECMLEMDDAIEVEEVEEWETCPPDETETPLRVAALDAPASATVTFTGLANGGYTLFARAIDETDKADESPASDGFEIDVPVPDPGPAVIDSGPANGTTSTSATFEFRSVPPGATFMCSLDAGAPAPCTSPQTYHSLSAGSHLFRVQAYDGATPLGDAATWPWAIGSEAITINLLWDGPPRDLDLHLQGSGEDGGPHVYYGAKCAGSEPNCWARLNWDITGANGPGAGTETISLFPSHPGFQAETFTIYVVNFACSSASFAPSNARIRILGGGVDHTIPISGATGALNAKQWNVASISVTSGGAASLSTTQTLTGPSCGSLPSITAARSVTASPPSAPSLTPSIATIEVEATVGEDGVEVSWLPADLEAEVRVSTDDFPDEITDGERGCTGTGRCVIDDVTPGSTLYLTVFPAGVTSLEPVEDVTSIRVDVPPAPEPSPEPEAEPAVEPEPSPDGTPPEEQPAPEPTPEPTPTPSPSP